MGLWKKRPGYSVERVNENAKVPCQSLVQKDAF